MDNVIQLNIQNKERTEKRVLRPNVVNVDFGNSKDKRALEALDVFIESISDLYNQIPDTIIINIDEDNKVDVHVGV